MRVSVDKEDVGYNPEAFLCTVTCNGELLEDCITADSNTDEAICYRRDRSGELVIDNKKGCLAREVVHGSILINFPDAVALERTGL